MTPLKEKIEKFHAAIRAEAFLAALAWCGNDVELLAQFAGMSPVTGRTWAMRGYISPGAAFILAKVPGFPLCAEEMAPGVDFSQYRRRVCNKCGKVLLPPRSRRGCRLEKQNTANVETLAAAKSENLRLEADPELKQRLARQKKAAATRLGNERRAAAQAALEASIVCKPQGGLQLKKKYLVRAYRNPPGRPKKDAPPRPPKVPGKPQNIDLV